MPRNKGKELQNAAKGCKSVTSFLVTLRIAPHLPLGKYNVI